MGSASPSEQVKTGSGLRAASLLQLIREKPMGLLHTLWRPREINGGQYDRVSDQHTTLRQRSSAQIKETRRLTFRPVLQAKRLSTYLCRLSGVDRAVRHHCSAQTGNEEVVAAAGSTKLGRPPQTNGGSSDGGALNDEPSVADLYCPASGPYRCPDGAAFPYSDPLLLHEFNCRKEAGIQSP